MLEPRSTAKTPQPTTAPDFELGAELLIALIEQAKGNGHTDLVGWRTSLAGKIDPLMAAKRIDEACTRTFSPRAPRILTYTNGCFHPNNAWLEKVPRLQGFIGYERIPVTWEDVRTAFNTTLPAELTIKRQMIEINGRNELQEVGVITQYWAATFLYHLKHQVRLS